MADPSLCVWSENIFLWFENKVVLCFIWYQLYGHILHSLDFYLWRNFGIENNNFLQTNQSLTDKFKSGQGRIESRPDGGFLSSANPSVTFFLFEEVFKLEKVTKRGYISADFALAIHAKNLLQVFLLILKCLNSNFGHGNLLQHKERWKNQTYYLS